MTTKNQLRLKKSSILNVQLDEYKDFTFIVNGKRFKTSRIVADILSKKIRQIHKTDPSIDKFEFKTQKRGDFSNVLKLVNFEFNDIKNYEIPFLTETIQILQNDSFELKGLREPISNENVFQLIHLHEYLDLYSNEYESEIQYVSSHFFELYERKRDELEQLDQNILERIFQNEKFTIESEDQLLTFVNKLYLANSVNSYFYDYVNFTNVTVDKMIEFLNIFNKDDLTEGTWGQISSRLQHQIVLNKEKEKKNKSNNELVLSKFFDGNSFSGIISELTKTAGGNINDKKIIEISGNKYGYPAGSFSSLVDFNYNGDSYDSKNEQNSFIIFDFKDHLIDISAYSIKSTNNPNPSYLLNWVIEGSNDKNKWDVIDSHSNDKSLCSKGKICTFCIQKNNIFDRMLFRFIRLRMIGKNSTNNYYLEIRNIEFFGKYYNCKK